MEFDVLCAHGYNEMDKPRATLLLSCSAILTRLNTWSVLLFSRHGHNEMDEPRATLPLSCAAIDAHPRVLELYTRELENRGVARGGEVAAWQAAAAAEFASEFGVSKSGQYNVSLEQWLGSTWQGDALQVRHEVTDTFWRKKAEQAKGRAEAFAVADIESEIGGFRGSVSPEQWLGSAWQGDALQVSEMQWEKRSRPRKAQIEGTRRYNTTALGILQLEQWLGSTRWGDALQVSAAKCRQKLKNNKRGNGIALRIATLSKSERRDRAKHCRCGEHAGCTLCRSVCAVPCFHDAHPARLHDTGSVPS